MQRDILRPHILYAGLRRHRFLPFEWKVAFTRMEVVRTVTELKG